MIGYILGGGSSIFNSPHGLAMDIVRHIRIITNLWESSRANYFLHR
jgi:hypothetical protein